MALISCRPDEPRQSWSKRWGPLVSHETFPGDCGICHVTDRWDRLREDFSFDHDEQTGYPLEGAHAEAACLRCHNDRGPVDMYVARGCGGCHPDPHASALGLDCRRCHEQTSWEPTGLIAEHARTRFPLFGPHAVTPCERCHPGAPGGRFRGAPTECDLCHQADLARAISPDHVANGWTNDCQRCHRPVSWTGAYLRHDSFPLTGGHAGLDCTACHTGGVLGPIPSDCFSCHAADYQAAPNHVAQSYPQNCEQCHTTIAWTPAGYEHTTFLLIGPHNVSCNQCHPGGNTSTFTCLTCHSQGETDNDHDEVGGYVYSSSACLTCHPDGRE